MRELGRVLRIAVPIAAVLIMVLALRPAASVVSAQDRVDALSKTLVCPVCNGLSLDQSPSKVALDGVAFVTEKIDEGWSDDDIYEYWAGVYGTSAILDPGRSGLGPVLWGVPFALVLLGGYVILTRRRTDAPLVTDVSVVGQRMDQVTSDIEDLERQVADGELDPETAQELHDVYTAELAELSGNVSDVPVKTGVETKIKVGAAVIGAVSAVIGIVAIVGLNNPQSNATEGVINDVLNGRQVDLADVTNEEMEVVVANNPDILPMRRAL
ncbi:MAG: cytochrome c-type biogenesis protein CcmH, partial [Acidobacteria bacterium]|nr:cytochrome c-type biogenesis protein CcmH [Acidobacteriota bacterium]